MPLNVLKKKTLSFESEFAAAEKLASALESRMACETLQTSISAVHQLGGTSQAVQSLLRKDLEELGFQNEKKRLFVNTAVPSLRPDFYRPLGQTGIIAEVERGKTITNNMDLLDIWKTHLCAHADFLFLIVPLNRRSESGASIKAFDQASRRLATFFQPRNYINVDAVFLFGY